MARLLRSGALPPAADQAAPTAEEYQRIHERVRDYRQVFDAH